MKVNVLAFGIAREIFGGSQVSVEVDGNNTAALKALLEQQYPRLKNLASYMVAVNNNYAEDSLEISEHDEIAIIPPVSGG